MPSPRPATALALLLLAASASLSAADMLQVKPWAVPRPGVAEWPPEQTAKVADMVTFDWSGTGEKHGLYLLEDDSCPETFGDGTDGQRELVPPTRDASTTYMFPGPGNYTFVCPMPGHCEAGQKVTFTVA